MPSLVWFRRDLRLSDNPAVAAALRDGPATGIFVIDPVLWQRSGPRRRSYLAASLRRLSSGIAAVGGVGLSIHIGDPRQVVPDLAQRSSATVHATADFGPYGAARDTAVADRCSIRFAGSPFLHDPGSVTKPDGSGYRVFTPFYRAWRSLPIPAPQPGPAAWDAAPDAVERGPGWTVIDHEPDPPFAVGEEAARLRWERFVQERLAGYATMRDFPARGGTSGLSAALKFGEVHPRWLVADAGTLPGGEAFIRQLCWRDFYGHLLAELPQSARRNVQPVFDGVAWQAGPQADDAFAAWRQGRTGYPMVDAGMRELAERGSMPNRLRMVVASFLVKDLHLDWRRGARYFMQQLYDGDLANNQHGWQWTAGTGTDAAPYHRIFNPVLQGLRFDPEGDYVRRWVPQLRALAGAAAHEPWRQPRSLWPDYPDRIVDHAAERDAAMAIYRAAKPAAAP